MKYSNERGDKTDRTVRPLGVFFWGLGDPFEDEPGRTLRDMLTQYGTDALNLLDGG